MLVNTLRWRIPKENSDRQREFWQEVTDYQRSHPEKVFYTRSRFFTSWEEGASEEAWMFLDDYESREDYDKWIKTVREDPELVELAKSWYPRWDALIVPGLKKRGEVWTEIESLRVER